MTFKQLRKTSGKSIKEIAEELQISIHTLRKYEIGEVVPPGQKIIKMPEIYKTNSQSVLGALQECYLMNEEKFQKKVD